MFFVVYENLLTGQVREYLSEPVSYELATYYLREWRKKYVGKRFPNGQGFYPFGNSRLVPAV